MPCLLYTSAGSDSVLVSDDLFALAALLAGGDAGDLYRRLSLSSDRKSCLLYTSYVGFRFEWRLAAGVVIALAHDVIITLGILSLFHIEIDLTIVASLMSEMCIRDSSSTIPKSLSIRASSTKWSMRW